MLAARESIWIIAGNQAANLLNNNKAWSAGMDMYKVNEYTHATKIPAKLFCINAIIEMINSKPKAKN